MCAVWALLLAPLPTQDSITLPTGTPNNSTPQLPGGAGRSRRDSAHRSEQAQGLQGNTDAQFKA